MFWAFAGRFQHRGHYNECHAFPASLGQLGVLSWSRNGSGLWTPRQKPPTPLFVFQGIWLILLVILAARNVHEKNVLSETFFAPKKSLGGNLLMMLTDGGMQWQSGLRRVEKRLRKCQHDFTWHLNTLGERTAHIPRWDAAVSIIVT